MTGFSNETLFGRAMLGALVLLAACASDAPRIGASASAPDAREDDEQEDDEQVRPPGDSCGGNRARCADACVDIDSDPSHCGACGNACSAEESCVAGQCELWCPNMGVCNGICTDVRNDAANCGSCGHVCDAGQSCSDGICNAHVWSHALGGTYTGEASDVAVSPSGEVVVVGHFSGDMLEGADSYTSVWTDAFLLKLTPMGQPMWLRTLSGSGNDRALGVAIDADGRIAVVGDFDGVVTVGEDTLVSKGETDAFLALFAPEGKPLWGRRFGDAILDAASTPEAQQAVAVDFDSLGNVVVAGTFFKTIEIGQPFVGVHELEAFVTKVSAQGDIVWAIADSRMGSQAPTTLGIDDEDGIFVSGWFTGEIGLSGSPVVAQGSSDAFVAKLAKDGTTWLMHVGDANPQIGHALAVDPLTNTVVMGGSFQGTMDFGGNTISAANGGDEIFLARVSPSDKGIASAAFGNDGAQVASDVAITATGDVLVVGWFEVGVDFGVGTMASAGGEDALVAWFDADLHTTWSHRYGDFQTQRARAVAAQNDHAVVAGDFAGTIDLGAGPLTAPSGASHVFVAAFQP